MRGEEPVFHGGLSRKLRARRYDEPEGWVTAVLLSSHSLSVASRSRRRRKGRKGDHARECGWTADCKGRWRGRWWRKREDQPSRDLTATCFAYARLCIREGKIRREAAESEEKKIARETGRKARAGVAIYYASAGKRIAAACLRWPERTMMIHCCLRIIIPVRFSERDFSRWMQVKYVVASILIDALISTNVD